MLQDFKKRFVVSSILTVPILILSPAIQGFLGFKFEFTRSIYILFLLSSFVYFYGGYPFLKGIFDELKKKNPEMMMLIVAISVAYFYSSAVVFGLKGKFFLGACNTYRHHASRPLHRDAICFRGIESFRGARQDYAFSSPPHKER